MENPIKMDDLGVPLFSDTVFQMFFFVSFNYAYYFSFSDRTGDTAHQVRVVLRNTS